MVANGKLNYEVYKELMMKSVGEESSWVKPIEEAVTICKKMLGRKEMSINQKKLV